MAITDYGLEEIVPYYDDNGEKNITENVSLDDIDSKEINIIPTNQYARAMRMQMENKNMLQKKGSLYVGTGFQQTMTIYLSDGSSQIISTPITAPLNPPANDNKTYILKCTNGELMWVEENPNS